MLGRSAGAAMPDGIYLIADLPSEGPLGLAALQNISWRNRSCSIDLYIGNKKMRSRMAAAVAAFRAIEYTFNELNMHRISAFIYSFNTPSWRLMERAGATRELVLRDHVVRDGAFHDMYCYGLLRREFQQFVANNAGYQALSAAAATAPSAPEAL
jgi:RimJ/RimL family protein N-acetyltransferase